MIRNAVLAMLALVCASSIADARPRATGLHPDCNVTMPCEVVVKTQMNSDLVASGRKQPKPGVETADIGIARSGIRASFSSAAAPARYIAGRLSCAKNVNAALAARGIRGTGSALARSFLVWGRASHPVLGAVAVYSRGRRGGHVALVSRVEGGRVYVLNPSSHRQRWVEMVYPRRALAYRMGL
jgi:hypothetical protein